MALGTVAAFSSNGTASTTPAIVHVSNGVSKPALRASGIYRDGWLQKDSSVVLPGGEAANLVLHLQVPLQPTQHLQISVDGTPVASRTVKPGPLVLRVPIAEATAARHVDIRWDHVAKLTPPDTRSAAAQLTYLAVVPPPTALVLPDGLATSGASTSGIYSDGWSRQVSQIRLAPGPAAKLVVRATIPRGVRQQVTVSVNGRTLAIEKLRAGSANLQLPVAASRTSRDVTLRWGHLFELHAPDTRHVAALLQYVGVAVPPAAVNVPADLANPGFTSAGIYADGWLEQRSSLVLRGGAAANLVIDANVPQQSMQTLAVDVNGALVASRTVAPGRLELSTPIPASAVPRVVRLRWAHVIQLSAKDRRRASAQLTRIAVAMPPASVSMPKGLADPGLSSSGIYKDGWSQQDASLMLAGGGAGNLVIQANVPKQTGQELTVTVDGNQVASQAVQPGKLDLRLPIPATASSRLVKLHWAQTTALAAPDTRRAAAQLTRIAVVLPPQSVSVPTGLSDPGLTTSGVYADGWLQQNSLLVLAGGKAGTLAISAEYPGLDHAELIVSVNGQKVADRAVKPGTVDVHIPIAASQDARRIALHWSTTVHLAAPDTRTASARLLSIAIR